MRLAETWEISTLKGEQSEIILSGNKRVPIGALRDGPAKSLPIMAKYLDCQGALSLQVHPTDAAAKYLHERFQYPLRDKTGKEETFFVLKRSPGDCVNLFLGFNRKELNPLVVKLRKTCRELLKDEADSIGIRRKFWSTLWMTLIETFFKGLEHRKKRSKKRSDYALSADDEQDLLNWLKTQECEDEIDQVFSYHLDGVQKEPNEASNVPRRLLGNEYLFVGVGIIHLIRKLRERFEYRSMTLEGAARDEYLGVAKRIFGAQCLALNFRDLGEHPLLRFFHATSVPSDRWGRVPPGTVHAWQGGGNFLIELADCSDNTFRILDYGRELTGDPREMHYKAAMYALNNNSFFDNDQGDRLVDDKSQGDARCHRVLGCKVLTGEGESPSCLETKKGWNFLMNPDGAIDLTLSDDTQFRHTSVARCRTILMESGPSVKVMPQERGDRVLHFYGRPKEPDMLCLCLGGTRPQAGLWRDAYPSMTSWLLDNVDVAKSDIEKLIEVGRAKAENWLTGNEVKVGLSWPGYIDRAKNIRYSSLLGKYADTKLEHVTVLQDFHAAVLGEVYHPLGSLHPKRPGALINIGRGICIAFYHPGLSGASFNSVVSMFKDDCLTACSGVGRWLYMSLRDGGAESGDRLDNVCKILADRKKTEAAKPSDDQKPSIKALVFRDKPIEDGGDWVRASKYFSMSGMLARLGPACSSETFEATLKRHEHLARQHPSSVHQAMFSLEEGLRARDFVEFGKDLARLIRKVGEALDDLSRNQDNRGEAGHLDGSAFARIKNDCLRGRIVLSGHVGQYFGLGQGATKEDPVIMALNQELDKDDLVRRSEIDVAAEREAAGFVYYRRLAEAPGG